MRKRLYMTGMILMIVVLAAACGNGGGSGTNANQGEGGGTVKIGCVYPLSGSNALLGEESLRGAQLAIDEINENGGIWGKKIELVVADAPDVTAGQTESERLIAKENIQLLFGSYSTGLANVNSDVAARYKVPFFELGAVGMDILKKGYPYVWRTCANAHHLGSSDVDFFDAEVAPVLKKNKKDYKIVIAHEDGQYGTTLAEGSVNRLTELGYAKANIKVIPYSATSVDLSTVILDAKAFGADGFFTTSYVNDAILLGRQAKELNFQPRVWVGNGGGHSMLDTRDALGKDIYGVFDSDFPQYNIQAPGVEDYLKRYREKYGDEPRSGHSMTNYVGVQMMCKVLEQAGSFDPEKVKEAAAKTDDPAGTYANGWGCKFDESGQNVNVGAPITMWSGDPLRLYTVYPKEFAVEKPVIPMKTWAEKAAM